MGDKENYKGTIISAAIGSAFFAIPYLALGVSILPSLGIAAVGFGASNLIFSENKKEIGIDKKKNLYELLNEAKKENASIYEMRDKIDDKELVQNIVEIHETSGKIIDTISKNPDKLDKADNFFSYYLPVTLKILKRYDDIENQRLESSDSKKVMKSTKDIIEKINKSFKVQLSNLYQSDIIDTDAEIKVFESMLNSDGFSNLDDFNIKK